MRLGIVDSSNFLDFPIGGQLTSMRNLVAGLKSVPGMEVCCIGLSASQSDSDQAGDTLPDGTPFLSVTWLDSDAGSPSHSTRAAFLRGLLLHLRELRSLRCDMFLLNAPEGFPALRMACPRTPVFTFAHGAYGNIFSHIRFARWRTSWMKRLLDRYLSWVMRTSEGLLVLDAESEAECVRFNRKVYRVRNGIDLSRYGALIHPERLTHVLYAGRLSANKRIAEMVEAFSSLPEVWFDIIGTGEQEQALRDQIERLGNERIRLLGRMSPDELARRLPAYDVLAMNSEAEGLPMVLLEAMASGLAILTTKVGGIGEWMKEPLNGCFTNGTVEGMRDAWQRLKEGNWQEVRAYNRSFANQFDRRAVSGDIAHILLQAPERVEIRGARITPCFGVSHAYALLEHAMERKCEAAPGGYVCFANVSTVLEGLENLDFQEITNHSLFTFPDGMPLVQAARRKGIAFTNRCAGPDFMSYALARRWFGRPSRHFLYGSTPTVLADLQEKIKVSYPEVFVVGVIAPPYGEYSEKDVARDCERIQQAQPDLVWVGLGAPKQERWMAMASRYLSVPLLGVGAAFDFLAGTKKRAPRWMQRLGVEWLFRLVTEPRRLWKRYTHAMLRW